MPVDISKAKGAFYGAILGDIIGVPYEFKDRLTIAAYGVKPDIDVEIRDKTYPGVPYNYWSDDGAHILALADAFLSGNWLATFVQNMIAWRWDGAFCSGGKKFDIGNTTAEAITNWEDGMFADAVRDSEQQANGALMRTLPCAFFDFDRGQELAVQHTRLTHNSGVAIASSQYATAIVNHLISGLSLAEARTAVADYNFAFILPRVEDEANHSGSGWCISTLGIGLKCAEESSSVLDAIQRAIVYGNDTDTNACVAGMFAGAIHGFDETVAERVSKIANIALVDSIWERIEKTLGDSQS